MKPDGVAMATMEPTEALGGEPSQPVTSVVVMEEEEEVVPPEGSPPTQPEEQAQGATAPPAPQEGNDKAAETKDKPKGTTKARPGTGGTAGTKLTSQTRPSSRPGTAPGRVMNGVKPSTNDLTKKTAPDKKRTTTTTSTGAASAAAAKKPVGGATAAASSVRTQTKVTDKKHVGVPRTNSAATTATNGTKTTTGNGTLSKRPTTGPVNGTRPKTTAPRPTSAPKPSTSVAKPDRMTVPKATRPATQPPTSRPGVSTATSKPPGTSTTARPPAHRLGATAPPAVRTTVAPSSKPTTAKKDVTKPPAKKPVAAATNKTTKPDAPKPTAAPRSDPVSKHPPPSKTADLKTARPQATRKAPPTARPPATRQPLGRTPPASPITKPAAGGTAQSIKRTSKPTQSVVPFSITKKPHGATVAVTAAVTAAVVAVVSATSTEPEVAAQAEAEEVSPEVPSALVPALITVSPPSPSPVEVTPPGYHDTPTVDLTSPPLSPVMSTASLQQDPILAAVPLSPEQEPRPFLAEATPAVASLVESTQSEEPALLMPEVSETSSPVALEASAPQGDVIFKAEANLNEDEEEDDEEEREGSQQVSVSDMSGTQPTEESRPGSAGPAGGSAWRGGGALLSELDSEEVSCSQQGASELSAPGVLEGTESMDDLGDASLKGAIVDMEGASAGSPDFEKVPDIPANDFEEDEEEDEDDDDRVCDMEVGSERAEDPRRVRHEEEEEEDEDVEMASEGVTESGLESYGNADEDDFAEDERLDNLNRAALLHPAPLLPSAAQWDQPNNPWAQPFQPAQNASAPLLAPASPSVDAWQADSETPTQSPAQAWLELGSAPFVPQEPALHMPSASLPKLSPAQGLDEEHQPGLGPMQTLAPAPISGPGMSQSSTLSSADLATHSSSETSTPEELRNYNKEGKLHGGQAPAPVLSLQPDPEDQDLGIHLEQGDGEEEEAETLPADEVLGGPATAPTSNPSSSSTSEDEASDTEGEAQLDEPLEDGGIVNAAFEAKPAAAAQRCLSALEEGEEAIGEEWGGDTPHSANSAASYGFDMTTTASSSNAHSAGEGCPKSPGIFSLEELPEEDKAPSLIGEPTSPRQPSSGEPPVDLLPLGGDGGGSHPDEHLYMLCGRQGAELGEFGDLGGPLDPSLSLGSRHPEPGSDAQPPYYSAICEKTENSLEG
ncbi:proline-rich protein 36 isoform X2 [Hypomesus transpacificus]|nr:proline-rich protein 36 isoform X2 [Hypomesus transpacificus]